MTVDYFTSDIEFTEEEHRKYKTLYSGTVRYLVNFKQHSAGQITGASASGHVVHVDAFIRWYFTRPWYGYKGPTAIIKSVSKMANEDMNIGLGIFLRVMAGC